MPALKRAAPFLFLQFVPLLIYPPALLGAGLPIVGIVIVALVGLGFMVWRAQAWALNLSLFLQGFNVIIRVMMLFPHALNPPADGGGVDVLFVVASLLAIGLSWLFLYQFDRADLRAAMTT
ncbi:MAG TPA: hypothetical protein VJG32_17490 [Anaerolineae bacterium]|nr:hypothetical protein [Anaerolineae bacterium]